MRLTEVLPIVLCAGIGFTGGGAAFAQDLAARNPVPASEAQASKPLPSDVYPDSRFRLPLPRREDFDDYGKTVFDKVADPNRKSLVGLRGPGGIRLYSPKVSEPNTAMNNYLRRGTGFGDRLTEIAILVTAREMENQFEWNAHEIAGSAAGVEPAIIDIIKYRKPAALGATNGIGEKEAVVIDFGRQLFATRKVSQATFAQALRLFGKKGLVDLVSLMTSYSATAALLNAFDMQLPEGQESLLPLP
jgi:4-carboxymuconolactone decarboxylase